MKILPNAKDIIIQWIADLRSGNFKQGEFFLKLVDNDVPEYCCLGVLCDTNIGNLDLDMTWFGNTAEYDKSSFGLTPEVREKLGIPTHVEYLFTQLNDRYHFNFNQIADILEAMLDQKLIGPQ